MRTLVCKYFAKRLAMFPALFAFIGMGLLPMAAHANVKNALWLGASPAPADAPFCEMHEPQPEAKESKRGGKPSGARGGRPDTPQRFESEHRPTPVRTYYLNGPALSPDAEAYVLHPDGSSDPLKIQYGPKASVTLKTPMADDKFHGANNIYVIDKQVKGVVLEVKSAKWLTIHHSCGWGHDYRNDETRTSAHPLNTVPLEIVINGLWDGNFHADARSGKELAILVTSEGTPVEGAEVTVTTEKKWSLTATTGEDGIAKVQLIRDYYPKGWEQFKRDQKGSFTVTAEYSKSKIGRYKGQPYSKVHYIATFPWKYSPAEADYQSYAFGLGLGTFSMAFAGLGIYTFRERRKKPYKGIDLK